MKKIVKSPTERARGLLLLAQDYKKTFEHEAGRRVLKHLAKIGYVMETTYCPGDPDETKHREGMRRIVLSILKILHKDELQLLERINELTLSEE